MQQLIHNFVISHTSVGRGMVNLEKSLQIPVSSKQSNKPVVHCPVGGALMFGACADLPSPVSILKL